MGIFKAGYDLDNVTKDLGRSIRAAIPCRQRGPAFLSDTGETFQARVGTKAPLVPNLGIDSFHDSCSQLSSNLGSSRGVLTGLLLLWIDR
jgi:hypothetical protein